MASQKLESSQAHAKKAFDSTAAAAREVANVACTATQSAFHDSKESLSAAARDIGDAARATCSSIVEQSAIFGEEYREKLADFEGEVIDYVRQKPLHSVAIAFGIGLLAGIILNRK